ncbi:MAG TPA: response regulator [Candidatus Sulfopaludibacter sp.]|nr:response regulator [Candidatus Sulfopaludibacter sp.]
MRLSNNPVGLRPSILLVDDDDAVRRLIHRILAAQEFDVIQAASGNEALSELENRHQPVDLVLTDIQMPGMTGIELAAQACLRNSGVKVLLMSAWPAETAELKPGWHFLPKPFAPQLLLEKIDLILRENRAAKEGAILARSRPDALEHSQPEHDGELRDRTTNIRPIPPKRESG